MQAGSTRRAIPPSCALRIIDARASIITASPLRRFAELRATHGSLLTRFGRRLMRFQPWMQVTLLNYFAFPPRILREKYTRLNDPGKQETTRCALPVCEHLAAILIRPPTLICCAMRRPRKTRWEYAAIASSVLGGSYPGAEIAAVLRGTLSSQLVSVNAPKSLGAARSIPVI